MNKLLKNRGLKALTVAAERREIRAVMDSHPLGRRAAAAEAAGHKIVFAFFQSDFKGGRIPYWHCVDSKQKSYHSTLSLEGLKLWGVL